MEFFLICVVLAIVSIVWAYLSLKQEMKKTEDEKKVKEHLSKGRVIFYPSDSDSSESKAS